MQSGIDPYLCDAPPTVAAGAPLRLALHCPGQDGAVGPLELQTRFPPFMDFGRLKPAPHPPPPRQEVTDCPAVFWPLVASPPPPMELVTSFHLGLLRCPLLCLNMNLSLLLRAATEANQITQVQGSCRGLARPRALGSQ